VTNRAPPPPDEAHIWLTLPDELSNSKLLDAYHALLSPEEQERRRRYHFDEHRHEYLVTRALVRTVLSRYAEVDPAAWVFEANAYGRPAIARPTAAAGIRFNLSNTKGLITCVVAADRDVGIDVEDAERAVRALDVADRFFSPLEVAALRALPEGAQGERFTAYWTLKEAYIKARGMGLAIPLDHFSFLLDEGPRVKIAFDPRLDDDPEAWQFLRLRPTRKHRIAAAIRRGSDAPLRVVVRRTAPLVW
jgi:4'-phosphopantetheinyl transferase